MKTKTLLMIAAAGAGYLAYRGSQVAPTVPVTPANATTLIRAGWNATIHGTAPSAPATAVSAPSSSSTPAAMQPTTPATTPAAQGYLAGYGYSE